ncbi:MAG TPA: GNAT family N-acetyltransferase [Hyphomicrobiaceae bacterium]|nr:GNAT family N-acetyltransferase [Hyphomicrobiaceae bacterium]
MTASDNLAFRDAIEADLPAIIALLGDDQFGQARNPAFETNREKYLAAFRELEANPNDGYVVAEAGGRIVGVMQLSYLRGLSYSGGLRAQVESVRIASDLRGRGLGSKMMEEACRRARARGAVLVQLTTDARRIEARRFYERLGFSGSHVGMKKFL